MAMLSILLLRYLSRAARSSVDGGLLAHTPSYAQSLALGQSNIAYVDKQQ